MRCDHQRGTLRDFWIARGPLHRRCWIATSTRSRFLSLSSIATGPVQRVRSRHHFQPPLLHQMQQVQRWGQKATHRKLPPLTGMLRRGERLCRPPHPVRRARLQGPHAIFVAVAAPIFRTAKDEGPAASLVGADPLVETAPLGLPGPHDPPFKRAAAEIGDVPTNGRCANGGAGGLGAQARLACPTFEHRLWSTVAPVVTWIFRKHPVPSQRHAADSDHATRFELRVDALTPRRCLGQHHYLQRV